MTKAYFINKDELRIIIHALKASVDNYKVFVEGHGEETEDEKEKYGLTLELLADLESELANYGN